MMPAVAVTGRIAALASACVVAATAVSGCTPAQDKSTVVVFAAASLKEAFTEIGQRFTADNPGAEVEFSFAGSADLVTQLTQGAPADVFASADTKNMDKVSAAGLLSGTPVNFASNALEIVVAPGNPKSITSLRDLTQPGLLVVTCAPQVPCGSATQKVEQAAGVTLSPVSEESQVSDVLNKVRSGQADAGLVYVTDVMAAGDAVTGVAFPESAAAVNTYPVAVLKDSRSPGLAQTFVDLVTGDAGRATLAGHGFGKN
jgi:molybdate transport system substrate-binding protein